MKVLQVEYDDGCAAGHGPQQFGMMFAPVYRWLAEAFAAMHTMRGKPSTVSELWLAQTEDSRATVTALSDEPAIRRWAADTGITWAPTIGAWAFDTERTVATLKRGDGEEDVTVTLSPDGRTVRLFDHETYYASNTQTIPLSVIEALRPGGKHFEDEAEEDWVDK